IQLHESLKSFVEILNNSSHRSSPLVESHSILQWKIEVLVEFFQQKQERVEQAKLEKEKKEKLEREKLNKEKEEQQEIKKLIELYTSNYSCKYYVASEILFQDYTILIAHFKKLSEYKNKLTNNNLNYQQELLKELESAINNINKEEQTFINLINTTESIIQLYKKNLNNITNLDKLIIHIESIIKYLPKKIIPPSDHHFYKEIIDTLSLSLTKTCQTMPKNLLKHCNNLALWHNVLLRFDKNDQSNIVAPLLETIESTMKEILTEWINCQIVTEPIGTLEQSKQAWYTLIDKTININEKNAFLNTCIENAKSMIANPSPELQNIKKQNDTLHNIRDLIFTKYDQNSISPAALIHYDLNILKNDLDTLNNSEKGIKYNLDLKKYYTQSIEHLTDIQTKIKDIIVRINAHTQLLSSDNN